MSKCRECSRRHECISGESLGGCDNYVSFAPKTLKECISAVANPHSLMGVDLAPEGIPDNSVMAFMINLTTLEADTNVAKYNHLAEECMSPMFENVKFKDNFEIERLVVAITAAARSHGSKAMLRIRKH